MRAIGRFWHDRRGNFALTTALLSPMLLGLVGFAVDYSVFFSQRAQMQEAADAAALAAIREASLNSWNDRTAQAVVDAFVAEAMAASSVTDAVYSSSVKVDPQKRSLTVGIRQDGHGYFLLGLFKDNPQIGVTSTAVLAGATSICALTLDPGKAATIEVTNLSSLTANDCGIFANSSDAKAISVNRGSRLSASTICSAGGYEGRKGDFAPEPVTDCPRIDDPLAQRPAPSFGKCDYKDTVINLPRTISPGVYCGGIRIGGLGRVRARPGIYVIKDGPFAIGGAGSLVGEGVGFFLTGSAARTSFDLLTTISLSAPQDGPMAGILIFEDRKSEKGRRFDISSKDARRMVGTIYLPKGTLEVRGASLFGNLSEWTAIIAQAIEIRDGPALKLNSDYEASDVPVPAGITGNERIYLSR